jgi:hypothetical protein
MNNEHMQFILDHITPHVALMTLGDVTDCERLIDPDLWDPVPAWERRYIFGRPVSRLVAQGKVALEFAGFDSKRHNLYRKI